MPSRFLIYFNCFLSYTVRDSEVQELKPIVDIFIDRLRAAGLNTCEFPIFYDYASLPPHPRDDSQLRHDLESAILGSVCMISFVSPLYFSSEWCKLELDYMNKVASWRGPPPSVVLPIEWKPLGDKHRSFRNETLSIWRVAGPSQRNTEQFKRTVLDSVIFVRDKTKELARQQNQVNAEKNPENRSIVFEPYNSHVWWPKNEA